MSEEEKLMKMFIAVHGSIDNDSSSCYLEVIESEDWDNYGEVIGISLCKDGNICWSKTKVDILFDYITKDWV